MFVLNRAIDGFAALSIFRHRVGMSAYQLPLASGVVSLVACRYDDPDKTSIEYKASSFFAVSAAR